MQSDKEAKRKDIREIGLIELVTHTDFTILEFEFNELAHVVYCYRTSSLIRAWDINGYLMKQGTQTHRSGLGCSKGGVRTMRCEV
jgi:hypothetical protein